MKKVVFYSMLFVIPCLSAAILTDKSVPPIQTDYFKKSKNQKTAAWICLGGGFALATTSVLIVYAKAVGTAVTIFGGVPPPPENDDYATESILLITGAAAMIASIPLFIAAGKNKRRAIINMTANIKMENATIFQKQSLIQSSYPAFAFKISL